MVKNSIANKLREKLDKQRYIGNVLNQLETENITFNDLEKKLLKKASNLLKQVSSNFQDFVIFCRIPKQEEEYELRKVFFVLNPYEKGDFFKVLNTANILKYSSEWIEELIKNPHEFYSTSKSKNLFEVCSKLEEVYKFTKSENFASLFVGII